jgi:hypothetical protein
VASASPLPNAGASVTLNNLGDLTEIERTMPHSLRQRKSEIACSPPGMTNAG